LTKFHQTKLPHFALVIASVLCLFVQLLHRLLRRQYLQLNFLLLPQPPRQLRFLQSLQRRLLPFPRLRFQQFSLLQLRQKFRHSNQLYLQLKFLLYYQQELQRLLRSNQRNSLRYHQRDLLKYRLEPQH
jgi:hypothetical protein